MKLGLKSGVAELFDHDPMWEKNAAATIEKLRRVFGAAAKDIQHIGSTSVRGIKAKPVIDIVVAADDFDEILAFTAELEENGFFFRGWEGGGTRPRFQCGELVGDEMRVLTHFIHVVLTDSETWHDYINMRDYLNARPDAAREYEKLKLRLADEHKDDYQKYFQGKQEFISEMVCAANNWRAET